jgi:hypothetical protein
MLPVAANSLWVPGPKIRGDRPSAETAASASGRLSGLTAFASRWAAVLLGSRMPR